jgi:hypothetical protein
MESVYHWHGDVTEKMTVVMTTILTNTTAKMLVNVCTRIIRRVSQLERELLTLPEHLSSPPVLSGVRVTRSFVLCVYLEIVVCPFVLFRLTIVSVLRYTDSDCPFGIFKLCL